MNSNLDEAIERALTRFLPLLRINQLSSFARKIGIDASLACLAEKHQAMHLPLGTDQARIDHWFESISSCLSSSRKEELKLWCEDVLVPAYCQGNTDWFCLMHAFHDLSRLKRKKQLICPGWLLHIVDTLEQASTLPTLQISYKEVQDADHSLCITYANVAGVGLEDYKTWMEVFYDSAEVIFSDAAAINVLQVMIEPELKSDIFRKEPVVVQAFDRFVEKVDWTELRLEDAPLSIKRSWRVVS